MGSRVLQDVSANSGSTSLHRESSTGRSSLAAIVSVKKLRRTAGSYCRATLAMALLMHLFCGPAREVSAQQSTPSHRLLGNGLPTMGGGQSQMELLRRLQLLSGAAQAKGNDLLNSQKADPQMLDSLQRAMQSLQGLKGESPNENPRDQQRPGRNSDNSLPTPGRSGDSQGSQPQPGSQPRDNEKKSNPDRSAMQRIAEQMGLSLDGPDDQSTGTDTTGSDDRPRTTTSKPSAGQGRNAPRRPLPPGGVPVRPSGQEPQSGLPDSESQRRNGDGLSNGQSPQISPDGAGSRSGTTNADDPPKSSMRSLIDWLAGRDSAKSDNGQVTPGGPSPSTEGSLAGSNDSRNNSGAGTTQEPTTGTGRVATGTTGNRNDSIAGRDSTPLPQPSTGSDWFPGGGLAPPRKPGSNTNGEPDRNLQGTTDISDQTGNAMVAGPGQANGSGGNDDAATPQPQTAEDRLKSQRDERLDDLRDSSKSLRQKLIDIAKLARTESGRTSSPDSETSATEVDGLQAVLTDALAEATKGLAEHVDEMVTRDRFARSEQGRWQPGRQEERGGAFGRIGRFGNRASDWLADTVEPETMPLPGTDAGFSDSGPADTSNLINVFLALLIGGGVFYWLQQRKRVAGLISNAEATRTVAPATLNSRQDIVHAFHDLAARCPTLIADWWTHDRAAQALAVSRPDVNVEVRQLAQLYEQARYLPDESALTDEQLAAAKAAWLRCRKS